MPLNVPPKPLPDPQRSLVGFAVGDVEYAVQIAQVREIVVPLPLTALPHMPAHLAGVADHRGEVVPVVDLRSRFGLPKLAAPSRKSKWILVGVDGRTVGLAVDEVAGVFRVMTNDVRPAPDLGNGTSSRGIEGVVSRPSGLVFLLDLSSFETITASLRDAGVLDAASLDEVGRT